MGLRKESKVFDKYCRYQDFSQYALHFSGPSFCFPSTTYILELECGEKKHVTRKTFHRIALGETVSYIPEKTQDVLYSLVILFFLLTVFLAIFYSLFANRWF